MANIAIILLIGTNFLTLGILKCHGKRMDVLSQRIDILVSKNG